MRPPPAAASVASAQPAAAQSGSPGSPRRRRRHHHRQRLPPLLLLLGLLRLAGEALGSVGGVHPAPKYSTRLVRTRYGSLRGLVARGGSSSSGSGTSPADAGLEVEVYLGVPYATPPLGALRFMPPVTPSPWRGTRLADAMPPACPQRPPEPGPGTPGPQGAYLRRVAALLANQSEDCLYLNLYVPRPPGAAAMASPHTGSSSSSPDLLPTLLLIHGDSYSWGAGNPLDGTALASHGRLIVVSINFRLGILGFLKTSSKGSAQGNYGLMDLVAGVHWLKENLPAFGGDSNRLTLMGHGTGAALANFLAVSPMAKELVGRVILLGGSALSPWALQREPHAIKRRLGELLGCPGDPEAEDLAPCLRLKSVEELLGARLDVPRFTAGYAPFVDGAILPASQVAAQNFQPTVSSAGLMPLVPGQGSEFANFGDRDVLMGLTSDEAWLELTEQDLENGMNETRRDRILRTYVRNNYRYHLHEIYSTLRNEYTDWERGEPSPLAVCEGLLALLGDGQVAAPLLRLALLHSATGGRGYFLHFQPGERPSRKGEELPYLLGAPLLRPEVIGTNNYTTLDESLSRLLLHYLANFVRRGDPNGAAVSSMSSTGWAGPSSEPGVVSPPFWDSYDSINQLYLEAGRGTEMRSHYRGHKMSLWLNLLPQLHRPGYEVSMRHHHLAESSALYEGSVRGQSMAMPIPAPPLPPPRPTEPSISSSAAPSTTLPPATDCSTNFSSSLLPGPPATTVSNSTVHPNLGPGPNNLLHKLASSHYQSYTTALTVTIAVGVFLLLLNILIFAGIYYQRDKNGAPSVGIDPRSLIGPTDKKKDELLEIRCSGGALRDSPGLGKLSSMAGVGLHSGKRPLSSFLLADSPTEVDGHHQHKAVKYVAASCGGELEQLQLQEYERVLPASYFRSASPGRERTPSPCVDATMAAAVEGLDEDLLPEPPPPPKSPAPTSSVGLVCPGILRQPGTPGSTKKRVQIQEISV